MIPTHTVSVVLTSYNYARFLNEAIESVLCQTAAPGQVVIVDDQSSDESWPLIEHWRARDRRITALRTPERLGFIGSLNLGLAAADGHFIAILDSDDVWLPRRLESQLNVMEQPGNLAIGVCGGNCVLIDAHGRVIGDKNYPSSDAACRRALWYRNPFCHSATLIRRECFQRFGVYDEQFPMAQDLDLWFRFGQTFRFLNLPEKVTKYRISGANSSLRRQRRLVQTTIRVRLWASRHYGYPLSPGARASLGLVWCMQWLPTGLVHSLFHKVFLRYGNYLWRSSLGETLVEPAGRSEMTQAAPNTDAGLAVAGRRPETEWRL